MKQVIENLIQFEIDHQTIDQRDYHYVKNQIYRLLGLEHASDDLYPVSITTPSDALEPILDMLEQNQTLDGSQSHRDLFDAKIMNVFASLPSVIEKRFYQLHGSMRTDWLYDYAKSLNYIRMDRIMKNLSFIYHSTFGDMQITINLSKPEKDPRSIVNAIKEKNTTYPLCVLCVENEGFSGNALRDSRDQHRLISFDMNQETWFFQYSPYIYYNEHAIVISKIHRPMHIDETTLMNLLTLTDRFEGYFFGSNADLPIVGGSILTHDHYQGGKHHFPIENAPVLKTYHEDDVDIDMMQWPLSTIRLKAKNMQKLVELATQYLHRWQHYTNESLNLRAYTNQEPHHTITPIARKTSRGYELDLILRDNQTSIEHPLGIFHPHADKWHIKKENIGLIEAMGLAILPSRLLQAMADIKTYITKHTPLSDSASIHQAWIDSIKDHLDMNNLDRALHDAIGHVFEEVLVDCGVFKLDSQGIEAFDTFIKEVI